MLRITIQEASDAMTIKLDGRLVGPWVPELKCAWSKARPGIHHRHVALNLRDVTYADTAGKDALREIYRDAHPELVTGNPLAQYLADETTGCEQSEAAQRKLAETQPQVRQDSAWMQSALEATGERNLFTDLVSPTLICEPSLAKTLKQGSRRTCCKTDASLFRQGDDADGLYILESEGFLVTLEVEPGDVLMRTAPGPGTLLGLPEVIGNRPYGVSAIARKGASYNRLSRKDFVHELANQPALPLKILQILASEFEVASRAAATILDAGYGRN